MIHSPRPQAPLELPPPPLLPRQGFCPLWNGQGVHECLFFILENGIHWYGIHFIEDRPQPCMMATGDCKQCRAGWLPRQTGYVCAMRSETGGRYILRVTAYAYRHCPTLVLKRDLRSLPLWVARRGDGKQSPWKLRPAAVSKASTDLPPSVDTVHVLSMIWGVDLRRIAQAPPPDGDITPELQPYHPRARRRQA